MNMTQNQTLKIQFTSMSLNGISITFAQHMNPKNYYLDVLVLDIYNNFKSLYLRIKRIYME